MAAHAAALDRASEAALRLEASFPHYFKRERSFHLPIQMRIHILWHIVAYSLVSIYEQQYSMLSASHKQNIRNIRQTVRGILCIFLSTFLL